MTINYLNSIGVAMKLASITLGAWQRDLSAAIAIPHRKTAAPVQKTITYAIFTGIAKTKLYIDIFTSIFFFICPEKY